MTSSRSRSRATPPPPLPAPPPPPDTEITLWVLEFVLRQPIEDWIVNEIFLSLPLPSPLPPAIKKTILLRRIASELSRRRSVSGRTLHSLELIEELDRKVNAGPPSSAMRAAYCSVAVECAVKTLRHPDGESDFPDAVKRIWNRRVVDLNKSAADGLNSATLMAWRHLIVEALTKADSRDRLLEMDTKKEALDAVAAYLKGETEGMGPPFLDLVVKAGGICGRARGSREPRADAAAAAGRTDFIELETESQSASLPIANSSGNHEEDVMADDEDATDQDGRSASRFDRLHSPVVNKVTECLETSCADLQLAVEDPLPDAVAATSVNLDCRLSEMATTTEQPMQSVGRDADAAHKERTGTSTGRDKLRSLPRSLLMDRNPTAHTSEWGDDSINSSTENIPSLSKKVRIRRSQRWAASPLKLVENRKFARRRKIKKWSLLEEETLKQAVEKHGDGNWKFILSCHTTIFEDRTEVDLKDKWRNMLRHTLVDKFCTISTP